MAQAEAAVDFPVEPAPAFAVSQTTGATRYRWDPFAVFAGSWRFAALPGGGTRAVWRYVLRCRPARLAPVTERIGTWLLGHDIRRRIAGYARGCADEVVLDRARRHLEEDTAGR